MDTTIEEAGLFFDLIDPPSPLRGFGAAGADAAAAMRARRSALQKFRHAARVALRRLRQMIIAPKEPPRPTFERARPPPCLHSS
jgi:hypothetical protein